MSEEYKNQLRNMLRKLFQFDSADLDFGIYRIMNKKRDEIERFIDKDLIGAVNEEFEKYSESKQVNLKDGVEAIKADICEKLGDDAFDENDRIKQIYVTTPFAKELAEQYEEMCAVMKESDMSNQHKAEIFSHIYQFFSRYYDNGDFMTLRRYSQKEKYTIPYNGEEVVLHWANKDQYYIMTGEHFKNYRFNVGEYSIDFQIKDAKGTANNNKGDKRYFVLHKLDDNPDYDAESKNLSVFFEYRGLNKDEAKEYGKQKIQNKIEEKMVDLILSNIAEPGLKDALSRKESDRTVLKKHLYNYTKKNTTDYFIHKDLKGFLTRELDFYIKNEVFHLDDLGTENEVSVEQYVTRAKVMKNISLKIIDFLAQIEDFQKMLFEKKKFVLRTDYCMTLDNVPKELYSDILRNEGQVNEWRVLYGIGEEEKSSLTSCRNRSIDEIYLKEHPYLVIDTKFFDYKFKDELLALIDDLDEKVGGLMVNSENWQALNLMHEMYKEGVKCIYIDPPYNTGNDEFIYKDNYQHSSWLSMIWDRLERARELMSIDGTIYTSIDDGEQARLKTLQGGIFGNENFISNIIWQKKYTRSNDARWFSDNHDFITCYAKEKISFSPNLLPRSEDMNKAYSNPDNHQKGHWKSTPLHAKSGSNPNFIYTFKNAMTWNPPPGTFSRYSEETLKRLEEEDAIWFGANGKSTPSRKTFLCDVKDGITSVTLWLFQEVGHTHEATTELKNLFPNNPFPNPKPTKLIKRIIELSSDSNKWILDFFAGSGTTAHALLNLNKEDSGNRKYILVEMGDYFDTIMKPRIQKVMFSNNWKDGKPQSNDGISHIFKYQYLEQYEDTLNNIEFTEAGTVQRTLMDMDGYFLRYMLDFETRDSSPCRLNIEKLTKPFDYTLKITRGNETIDETIDLVETFNYLLGIHIKQIKTFNNNGTYYKTVVGKKDEDDIAIIWRDTENINLEADKTFIEGTILNGIKPSKTYINSDFYVKGAHPIESEFKRLMVV